VLHNAQASSLCIKVQLQSIHFIVAVALKAIEEENVTYKVLQEPFGFWEIWVFLPTVIRARLWSEISTGTLVENELVTPETCPFLQFEISQEALQILSQERDAQGRQLQAIKLPCPPVLTRTQEEWQSLVSTAGLCILH
jgi:hypothetical protein